MAYNKYYEYVCVEGCVRGGVCLGFIYIQVEVRVTDL